MHGDKGQNARTRALQSFRDGKARILVATDIAARGIDVPGISHVINYELPNEPESYVHRIGRTARAGAEGRAIAFCDSSERAYLRDIERLMRVSIPVESHRLAGADTREPHSEREPRSHAPRSQAPRSHAPKAHASKPRAAKTEGWHPHAKSHEPNGHASNGHASKTPAAKPQAAGQQTGKAWAGSRGRRGGALPTRRGALARPRVARVSFSGEPR